jgi:hypothetical protein
MLAPTWNRSTSLPLSSPVRKPVSCQVSLLPSVVGSSGRQLDAVPIGRVEHRDVPEIGLRGRDAAGGAAGGQSVRTVRGLEPEPAPSRRIVADRRHGGAEAVQADAESKALAEQGVFPLYGRETGKAAWVALSPQEEAGAFEPHPVRLDHRAGKVGENRRVVRRRAQMTPVQGAERVALDIDIRVERVQVVVEERIARLEELIGVGQRSRRGEQVRRGEDGQIETSRPAGCDRR